MEEQTSQQNNSAKFAYFYMLSLVALIFMSVSIGIIVFQIINKNIKDIADAFPGSYSAEALKFAISALIISAPIYYVTAWEINKNLFGGILDKNSGVRRWLTYFILFVSSVVMTGWLVATIYNFLDGELTIKFILKSLTSIIIAASTFSYYLYDIRRENVVGVKNMVIRIFFYTSTAVAVLALVSAFVFVESPQATRARKHDNAILDKFNIIDGNLNSYYSDNGKLPASLDELLKDGRYYMAEKDLDNPETREKFEYKTKGDNSYELCANFRISNNSDDANGYDYLTGRWPHDSGYQCLGQKVREDVKEVPAVKK